MEPFCNSQRPKIRARKSEYFLDVVGVMYKRRPDRGHQLVILKSLVQNIIKANNDPVYIAQPGVKGTLSQISLNYW
jgi:hypothetical protein